jgi:hypothetical protein
MLAVTEDMQERAGQEDEIRQCAQEMVPMSLHDEADGNGNYDAEGNVTVPAQRGNGGLELHHRLILVCADGYEYPIGWRVRALRRNACGLGGAS